MTSFTNDDGGGAESLDNLIKEDDDVIVYVNYKQLYNQKVKRGATFQMKYGALKHEFMIGKSFGSKIQCTKGFVYILRPTPELWAQVVSHRTQILYPPDMSLIVLQLDLKPGSIIVESGTGSGVFSHTIARTIAPNGQLFTFDFHEQRVAEARKEFEAHKLSSIITIAHRDVCSEGFGLEMASVDAVFLDLPTPWLAVEEAKRVLKFAGRFCSFSPCIEQIQRTCTKLRELGFSDIDVVECLTRSYRVQDTNMKKLVPKKIEEPKIDAEVEEPCLKKAKDDAEGHAMEPAVANDIAVEDASNFSEKANELKFRAALVAPPKQPTHTGYLAFATNYSKSSSTT